LKILITKKGWWVAQGVGPEFKPQYHKIKETTEVEVGAKTEGTTMWTSDMLKIHWVII
jgi:hypothetical protein